MFNKFKKNKRMKEVPQPRPADEIRKNYEALKLKAGEVQYLIYAYTEDLVKLNAAMKSCNQEFSLRESLDKQTKEKEANNGESQRS